MEYVRGRYSWVLRPLLIIYDLVIINLFTYYFLNFSDSQLYFFSHDILNNKYLLYFLYSLIFWPLSTYFTKFYKVYRYSSSLFVLSLLIKQFFVYSIITFAFTGIFRSIDLNAFVTLRYLLYSFYAIALVKFLSYYGLKVFRTFLRGNLRNVLLIGNGNRVNELKRIFTLKKELGYKLKGYIMIIRMI